MKPGNLFEGVADALPEEWTEVLTRGAGVRVERIVSRGHASPDGFWYDQEEEEWVIVVQGRARLEFEGDENWVELGAGDWLVLPARKRHRVAWTEPGVDTVWLAVFYRRKTE